jgi:putative CocE/NonD family hydrolase
LKLAMPSRSRRTARGSLLVGLTAFVLGLAGPAHASVDKWGYLPLADGTQLRYTVTLPAADGRFPVAMDYDGYCEGTGATTCNDRDMAMKLVRAGNAVLGVSVRGTGCSTGTFDFRSPEEQADGAAAVEWAAKQPWSTGRVGMFGDSFPGLTQPGVAALRPRGLAAIAPFQIIDDVYRDVGYPGGISNGEFGAFWGLADQPAADAQNPVLAAGQNDPRCAANYAAHQAQNGPSNIVVAGAQHMWDDSYWQSKAIGASAAKIDVPVLNCTTWQDDEVGSRSAWTLFPRIKPSLLWLIGSNGYHAGCEVSNTLIQDQVVRFFDRFVRGAHNGFESTPHVQIWHEAHQTTEGSATVNVPSWISTFRSWPPTTRPTAVYLRSDGLLASGRPADGEAGGSYLSPAPSAGTEEGIVFGQSHLMWDKPVPPGGALAWTTKPLTHDVETLGPASADLWISSTSVDTDLQVTITEVRPDGQETYVARGWLRASQRKLDPKLSTVTRPYQTQQQSDLQLLTPLTPVLARVEVLPFDHVFRARSAIRMIVDTPSQTGGWNFLVRPTAAQNTILHDREHPSRLVLGTLPGGRAKAPLPACNTLLNQPCRASAYPAPAGG